MESAELQEALKTLISLTAKYLEVFKNLPVPAAILDENGRVNDANEAFATLFPDKDGFMELIQGNSLEVSGEPFEVHVTQISVSKRYFYLLTAIPSEKPGVDAVAWQILRAAIRSENARSLLRNVASELGKLEVLTSVRMAVGGETEEVKKNDVVGTHEYEINCGDASLKLKSLRELSPHEISALREMLSDVSFIYRTLELEEELKENVHITLSLVERVREALKAIRLSVELMQNDDLKKIAMDQIKRLVEDFSNGVEKGQVVK